LYKQYHRQSLGKRSQHVILQALRDSKEYFSVNLTGDQWGIYCLLLSLRTASPSWRREFNMMFNMIRVLFLAVGVLLISSILASLAQPSEVEAKSAFERLGCTGCHARGSIAPPWDEVVSMFRSAAGKYPNLDEFVKAEVSQRVKAKLPDEPKSWDELFTVMARYVGKNPDDPNVKVVESFLASLLQAPGATTPPTVTPTSPPQVTTPQATTPAPEAVRGGERLTWGVILAAVAIAVIVLGALIVGLLVVRR
jgi:cytochrome c551/c552